MQLRWTEEGVEWDRGGEDEVVERKIRRWGDARRRRLIN